MVWDYVESNPHDDKWLGAVGWVANVCQTLGNGICGQVTQADARNGTPEVAGAILSTDPPYYDNIGYADLSDFFYGWLRSGLQGEHPSILSTMQTPKLAELIADPARHGGDRQKASSHFEAGLKEVFQRQRRYASQYFPATVYYAFKQAEVSIADRNEIASTGWETMLLGLIESGFHLTGTWPVRTERSNRTRNINSNALASSIVLVCRPRPADAPKQTRREFLVELKRELPEALKNLQHGNIAPVDLAQAAIGPGMAVFSRYSAVLESDGSPMRVRTALGLINQCLDEVLAEQEGEFDADTRWAIAWFEQHAHEDGPYGTAETLSTAKNVSVRGLEESGILKAKGGKVRLLRRDEYAADWSPEGDGRVPVWEAAQQLIRTLQCEGESGAARLLPRLRDHEAIRDLAYRLYTTCERKKWAQEALAYNSLVVAWPEIVKLSRQSSATQPHLFE